MLALARPGELGELAVAHLPAATHLTGVAVAAAAFLPMLWLHVSVHELGHAIAGWLVGARVRQLAIGTGRTLLLRRWCGVDLRLGAWPWAGHYVGSLRSLSVPAWAWLLAAGPLTTLALTGLGAYALRHVGPNVAILSVWLLASWFVLAGTVVQSKHAMAAPDLRAVVACIRRPAEVRSRLAWMRGLFEIQDLTERGEAALAATQLESQCAEQAAGTYQGFALRLVVATLRWASGEHEVALLQAQGVELPKDGGKAAAHMRCISVAFFALEPPARANLAVAKGAVEEAESLFPSAPLTAAIRGLFELRHGEPHAALTHLRRLWAHRDSIENAANGACYLAEAWAAVGRPDRAARWLARARRLRATNPVLTAVEQRIRAGSCTA